MVEKSEGTSNSRTPAAVMILLSAVIAAALIWLIYFKGRVEGPEWVTSLPAANAFFNSMSALCLGTGYYFIRRGNKASHQKMMLSATFFSGLFLVSYVVYHFYHGDTKFPGHGWVRPVYFGVLISHILLSVVALPMILASLWYGLTSQFQAHRKISRWTFPVWMYVSVTGVVVYFMLKAAMAA